MASVLVALTDDDQGHVGCASVTMRHAVSLFSVRYRPTLSMPVWAVWFWRCLIHWHLAGGNGRFIPAILPWLVCGHNSGAGAGKRPR